MFQTMGEVESPMVSTMESQIQRLKENLKGVDENLRRLTGRDFSESRSDRRNRISYGPSEDDGAPRKRVIPGGVFSRLGASTLDSFANNSKEGRRSSFQRNEFRGEGGKFQRGMSSEGKHPELPSAEVEDELIDTEFIEKPSVPSSVSRPIGNQKSRLEVSSELYGDRASKERNRRMFGALMGTLARFKNDEAKQKPKEEQRLAIEKKLEEKGRAEKEEMRRQQVKLVNKRKEHQAQIRVLASKITRVKEHEMWESTQLKLTNFIRSKSSPRIFWLPKVHNPMTSDLLADTKRAIENELESESNRMKRELEEILALQREADEEEDGRHKEEEEEEEDEQPRQQHQQVAHAEKKGNRHEKDPDEDIDTTADLLDYEAEEGELVLEESELILSAGKLNREKPERMVVQVGGGSDDGGATRRVELVKVEKVGGEGDSHREAEKRKKVKKEKSREGKRSKSGDESKERKHKHRGRDKADKDAEAAAEDDVEMKEVKVEAVVSRLMKVLPDEAKLLKEGSKLPLLEAVQEEEEEKPEVSAAPPLELKQVALPPGTSGTEQVEEPGTNENASTAASEDKAPPPLPPEVVEAADETVELTVEEGPGVEEEEEEEEEVGPGLLKGADVVLLPPRKESRSNEECGASEKRLSREEKREAEKRKQSSSSDRNKKEGADKSTSAPPSEREKQDPSSSAGGKDRRTCSKGKKEGRSGSSRRDHRRSRERDKRDYGWDRQKAPHAGCVGKERPERAQKAHPEKAPSRKGGKDKEAAGRGSERQGREGKKGGIRKTKEKSGGGHRKAASSFVSSSSSSSSEDSSNEEDSSDSSESGSSGTSSLSSDSESDYTSSSSSDYKSDQEARRKGVKRPAPGSEKDTYKRGESKRCRKDSRPTSSGGSKEKESGKDKRKATESDQSKRKRENMSRERDRKPDRSKDAKERKKPDEVK